jgi:hypothetical protein
MSERFTLVLSLIALCAVASFIGCGTEDLVFPGMLPLPTATITGTPGCLPAGDTCTLANDCCSGVCFSPDGVSLQCE